MCVCVVLDSRRKYVRVRALCSKRRQTRRPPYAPPPCMQAGRHDLEHSMFTERACTQTQSASTTTAMHDICIYMKALLACVAAAQNLARDRIHTHSRTRTRFNTLHFSGARCDRFSCDRARARTHTRLMSESRSLARACTHAFATCNSLHIYVCPARDRTRSHVYKSGWPRPRSRLDDGTNWYARARMHERRHCAAV